MSEKPYAIVIRRTGSQADVLLTTPIVHALREQRPNAEIYVETNFPEIFAGNPDVIEAAYAISPKYPEHWIDLDLVMPTIETYAKKATVTVTDRALRYTGSTPEDQKRMTDFLKQISDRPIAFINHCHRWPMENWEQVRRFLSESGRRVALMGETPISMHIKADVFFNEKPTTGALAFALMMSCLFVGEESFELLLAESQGSPIVRVVQDSTPASVIAAIETIWKREKQESATSEA